MQLFKKERQNEDLYFKCKDESFKRVESYKYLDTINGNDRKNHNVILN
jgi:hypothetical protein